MKGKALRRALETADCIRIAGDVPLITDKTELIGPQEAERLLKKNQRNRPINWSKVEEYAEIMQRGEWKLHPQGIILDPDGNILTGQTRLWAVVYSGVSVYLRISRGAPADTATVIDRGRPQSARDLSTRRTERKHSPLEATIARCVCVIRGTTKPSPDDIAEVIVEKSSLLSSIAKWSSGTKKSKAVLMVLGAIAEASSSLETARPLVSCSQVMADRLEIDLLPYSADKCWGRGVSFGMALKKAQAIVSDGLPANAATITRPA